MEILADKYIIGLYQELEDEVIADIARRVAITKRYTETAELMAKSMVEQGYSAAEIQAKVMKYLNANKEFRDAVAENTKAYKQEIQDIIDETVEKARAAGDALIAAAGNMAWNNDLSMWEEHGADLTKPNAMSAAITAMQKQTRGQLKNLTRSMGFKNTALGTTGVLDAYQKELDRALLKITTGVFSYDTAVNDCVKRLAESGLRSIDYASGRSYQLDTAARMCVRTGMSQLAGRITEMNLQQTGQDLVITSQHMGSRPEHAPWQNKVFSYSGKNKKYPDLVKETGYGTAEGLKGANCAHDFYPFWEGDVIPKDLTEPAPKKINGKEYTYYQCNQQMRKMERGIRATKREIEAQHAIGGDVTGLKAKLTAQRKAYYDFAASADIRPKENRLRIVAGSSDMKKTKAYRNNVLNRKSSSSGALNKTNDPYGAKRDKHAVMYYGELANRKPTYVAEKIAKNMGISAKAARNIYDHVFVKEHIFKSGEKKKFDPDYDMAESFRRILEGKNVKPHDIIMIKHEHLELNLIKKYNMAYEDAHELAEKKYNYSRALNEFLESVGG